MKQFVRRTEACWCCKYRTQSESASGDHVCCNYIAITNRSRRRNDDGSFQPLEQQEFCDKFDRGDKLIPSTSWTEMTYREIAEQNELVTFYSGRLHIRIRRQDEGS